VKREEMAGYNDKYRAAEKDKYLAMKTNSFCVKETNNNDATAGNLGVKMYRRN